MTRVRIRTPSRLHFGLLGWGPRASRQFGGVGLMIEAPGLELIAEPAPRWRAEGPLAARSLQVAEQVAARCAAAGSAIPPARLRIVRAPAEHAGLGTGTQLSLAVARVLTRLAGLPEPSLATLAALTGRGLRSGVGLHGFARGGLIVDGGHRASGGIPPLLARLPFPSDWSILVLLPESGPGVHGPAEAHAFAQIPAVPEATTDRLCRLVLLGLLPAVVEHDLESFGAALAELQDLVGRCFAPAQGGVYARPELEPIVTDLRARGLHGVGQSSWGPALYGFSEAPADREARILDTIRDRFGLGDAAAFWTEASQQGGTVDELI
jgi:beta-RFAP synthase